MKSPGVDHGQQLPCVVQVIACDFAEAEGVEVADGDGGEQHGRSHYLVYFGDVWKLQVELNPVHADVQQEAEGAQEEEQPQATSGCHSLVGEDVSYSVQRGRESKHLERRRMIVVRLSRRLHFHIHRLARVHSERLQLLSQEKNTHSFTFPKACTWSTIRTRIQIYTVCVWCITLSFSSGSTIQLFHPSR